jgi:uncharacterized protein (DUF983 family)
MSQQIPENPPQSALHKLWLGLTLRCPHCGEGYMSASFYDLKETCEVCGVRFERRPGEATGAMMIMLSVMPIIGLAVFFFMYTLITDSVWFLIGLVLVLEIAGIVVGYRYVRGLWVAVIELTSGLEPDDDPFEYERYSDRDNTS